MMDRETEQLYRELRDTEERMDELKRQYQELLHDIQRNLFDMEPERWS